MAPIMTLALRMPRVLRYAWRRLADADLTQVAGSLTFTTVLSLVPLLAVALALFAAFPLFADFRASFEEYLLASLLPADMAEVVLQHVSDFAAKATQLTAFGTAFLVVGAVAVMLTIDTALNRIWRVRRPRPLVQRILIYWTVITLGPMLFGISIWATTQLVRSSLGLLANLPWLVDLALRLGPILLTTVTVAALFFMVPNRRVLWRDAMVGATITALLFEAMKFGFAWYVTRFPTYNAIYGALAAIPLFLLWVYLSWLVLLFGAALSAIMPAVRHRATAFVVRPGDAWLPLALEVLALLERARSSRLPGCSMLDFLQELPADESVVECLLERLSQMGWVTSAEDRQGLRWHLICDPAQVRYADLSEAMFGLRASGLNLALGLEGLDRIKRAVGDLSLAAALRPAGSASGAAALTLYGGADGAQDRSGGLGHQRVASSRNPVPSATREGVSQGSR